MFDLSSIFAPLIDNLYLIFGAMIGFLVLIWSSTKLLYMLQISDFGLDVQNKADSTRAKRIEKMNSMKNSSFLKTRVSKAELGRLKADRLKQKQIQDKTNFWNNYKELRADKIRALNKKRDDFMANRKAQQHSKKAKQRIEDNKTQIELNKSLLSSNVTNTANEKKSLKQIREPRQEIIETKRLDKKIAKAESKKEFMSQKYNDAVENNLFMQSHNSKLTSSHVSKVRNS